MQFNSHRKVMLNSLKNVMLNCHINENVQIKVIKTSSVVLIRSL